MAVRLFADYIRTWPNFLESKLSVIGVNVPVALATWVNGATTTAYHIDKITHILPLHGGTPAIPNRLAINERQGRVNTKNFLALRILGADVVAAGCCEGIFEHSFCHGKALDLGGVTIHGLNEETIHEIETFRSILAEALESELKKGGS